MAGLCRVGWRMWAVLIAFQLAILCAEEVSGAPRSEDDHDLDLDVDGEVVARGKKKKKLKYLIIVLIVIVVIKSIVIPLALKGIAILSGKAFVLSALSLIVSSILGFKRFAESGWDRIAQMSMMRDRAEVTESSYHPMPTEAMYHKISTDQHWSRDFKNK